MPRNVYYQDAGNPLQRDRLPSDRPEIAFVSTAPTWRESRATLGRLLLLFEILLICTVIFFCYGGEEQGAVQFSMFFTASCFSLWALFTCSPRGLWARLTLIALSAASFLLPITIADQLSITAAVISLFAWQFGQHWTVVCTGSPLDRQLARAILRGWRLPLLFCAAIPISLALVAHFTAAFSACLLVLLLYCLVQIVYPRPNDAAVGRWRTIWHSLVSWATYNWHDRAAPGLILSPSGSWKARVHTTCLYFVLFSGFLSRIALALFWDLESAHGVDLQTGVVLFLALHLCLLLVPFVLPTVLLLPVLIDASRWRRTSMQPEDWPTLVQGMQNSADQTESRSYYMARVVADGSPFIVPREVFREHAHFLGDSGTGKTSLGLAPWIEQTVAFGDSSVVVVDLKADSLELFATLQRAAEDLHGRTGRRTPIKYFTNQSQLSTYAFNPLTQPYWSSFDPYIKTDILCGAAGLLYGTDYGAGWYSAANAAVLHYAIKNFPDVRTFGELAERVKYTLASAKKHELHPELRAAGVHVLAILERLGSFEALNVAPGSGYPEPVIERAIDLRDLFLRPQIIYFHLSSALAAGSSPEIARLLVYSLLCASTQTERRRQVYLVIDEFQRMVARNVEYMLQLARSMGVGIILANQSMQDLGDLIPAIEANCRYRQWFSVSSLDDSQRLSAVSGEMVELFTSISRGWSGSSRTSTTTVTEQLLPRLSRNDIALASDHPLRSIVTISRGSGFAQYGGLPFVVESNYHISAAEYSRRKAMRWPEPTIGTFVPKEHRSSSLAKRETPRPGPILTTEIIGDFKLGGPPPRAIPGHTNRHSNRLKSDQ